MTRGESRIDYQIVGGEVSIRNSSQVLTGRAGVLVTSNRAFNRGFVGLLHGRSETMAPDLKRAGCLEKHLNWQTDNCLTLGMGCTPHHFFPTMVGQLPAGLEAEKAPVKHRSRRTTSQRHAGRKGISKSAHWRAALDREGLNQGLGCHENAPSTSDNAF